MGKKKEERLLKKSERERNKKRIRNYKVKKPGA